MKLLKVFSLIVLAVFVFSCEKEEVKSQLEDSSSESGDVIKMVQDNPGGGSITYFLDVKSNNWCTKCGTNCSSPGIVTGTSASVQMEKLVIAISNGSDGVVDYFNGEDYLILFPSLEMNQYEMLDKLQSGAFSMEKLIDPNTENHFIYRAYAEDEESFGLQIYIEE